MDPNDQLRPQEDHTLANKGHRPTNSVREAVTEHSPLPKDGSGISISAIQRRLALEKQTNIAISVESVGKHAFVVSGRGALQLGILIEEMRRKDSR